MSIYMQKGSPFWWIYLEQRGGRGRRFSTRIPIRAGSKRIEQANRRQAEDMYAVKMGEAARDRYLAAQGTETPTAFRVELPPPPPFDEDGWCYVYFIQRGLAIKIGKTVDVRKRMSALQTAGHEPVTLLAAVRTHGSFERLVHRRFKHMCRAGEWFAVSDDLLSFIDELNKGINPAEALISISAKPKPSADAEESA